MMRLHTLTGCHYIEIADMLFATDIIEALRYATYLRHAII